MVEVFLVCPADRLWSDSLDGDAVDRFVETKGRVLGYNGASFLSTIEHGHIRLWPAPLYAVRTREDADRLIEELRSEFPNKNFVVEPRQYQDADQVVWHYVRHQL